MSAAVEVVTAVTGRWESVLVTGLGGRDDVEVVRRCADLADLLATVTSGVGRVAVVSADLRSLDADALDRLAAAGCCVVALVDPGDQAAVHRLDRLGVAQVLVADSAPEQVAAAVRAAATSGPRRAPLGLADPRSALPAPRRREDDAGPVGAASASGEDLDRVAAGGGGVRGRVVAVWGPTGAPGRTTVAVGLAAELAGSGSSALLVDADTYGSSIAQVLAVLDEAPGLLAATRAADRGGLDRHELARHAPEVHDRLRVLTGVVRPDRWPEVRGAAVSAVLEQARELATWTVVDTGFCLEQDEELSYDTVAPRRNAATLAALEAADVVVAVGSADPVGLQRLVRALPDLAEHTEAPRVVVANRVRSGAVGPSPGRRVREALARYAGVEDPVLVPYDLAALDAAMLAGRTLAEHARASPVRQALQDLVTRVSDTGHRGDGPGGSPRAGSPRTLTR